MGHSQAKEDVFIKSIFDEIGSTNKTCVEFGGADGYRCSNTRSFIDDGWTGHFWDIDPKSDEVKKEKITAESINDIFAKYEVPQDLDLLSIDIDSNDYWVWKALNYKPRVVIIEFNPSIPKTSALTIKYDPNFSFRRTNYFGASFLALKLLGEHKGYDLITCIGCNMIFALKECGATPLNNVTYKCAAGWPLDKTIGNVWIDVEEDLNNGSTV